jgi:hypothetical protein
MAMRPCPPNYFFPDTAFAGIRRRLLRLAGSLSDFHSVDTLYEEILDCFTSFGVDRNTRTDRVIPELPWTAFIPDTELEVNEYTALD